MSKLIIELKRDGQVDPADSKLFEVKSFAEATKLLVLDLVQTASSIFCDEVIRVTARSLSSEATEQRAGWTCGSMLVLLALQLGGGRVSYKCAHCKGHHAKIETVRQCAKEYNRERVKAVLEAPTAVTVPGAPVPVGFYWSGGDRGYMVVQVRRPAEGRWKGRYFVNVRYDGQPWQAIFEKELRENLLDTLRAGDWGNLMLEFGQHTGWCPVCNERLDPVEKQVGVHGLSGPQGDGCAKTVVGR